MKRRDALLALLAFGATPSIARSQPTAKIRKVGFISAQSSTSGASLFEAFKAGMRDLGWREGQNVEYRAGYGDGRIERLDEVAKDLVAKKVEVIVVGGAPVTRAAQKATATIPIVMANVSNAVDNGFVASLARPGGNITGVTNQYEEVLGKLIEIFHETVPRARRVAILVNESSPSHRAYWAAAQNACAAFKLTPFRVAARTPVDLPAAVARIVSEQAQAIVVVLDGMFLSERKQLEELIRPTRLPAAYAFREHALEGGLLSYAADLTRAWRYSATFVDKILKGARPADLPVEQPTKFELVINLKTAKALGIAVPPAVLQRADEVIQ